MIKVKQTIFEPPSGNCLAACVASIFERPLWTVPNFVINNKKSSIEDLADWAYREHNVDVIELYNPFFDKKMTKDDHLPWWGTFCNYNRIATVKSNNIEDGLHCIVVSDYGNAVWDPNPTKSKNKIDLQDLSNYYSWLLFVNDGTRCNLGEYDH